jgi:hypothetical protein
LPSETQCVCDVAALDLSNRRGRNLGSLRLRTLSLGTAGNQVQGGRQSQSNGKNEGSSLSHGIKTPIHRFQSAGADKLNMWPGRASPLLCYRDNSALTRYINFGNRRKLGEDWRRKDEEEGQTGTMAQTPRIIRFKLSSACCRSAKNAGSRQRIKKENCK